MTTNASKKQKLNQNNAKRNSVKRSVVYFKTQTSLHFKIFKNPRTLSRVKYYLPAYWRKINLNHFVQN